jgi:polyhydroxyalkanoate synthase subunit PhaC
MELIRYRPTTERVKSEPVLIVPAWIMKYYMLDLSPAQLAHPPSGRPGLRGVLHLLAQSRPRAPRLGSGRLSAATASWRLWTSRPGSPGAARSTASAIASAGPLLSIAGAAMARDGDDAPEVDLTLFAALVDFDEPGEIGLFIDEAQVAMLDDLMWSDGYLDQRRMAGAFQMLRSQDLLWSRMVRDYLLGEREPMNDLMAWNADATRMPYRMHSEYLHGLYLGNELALGQFRVDGAPVHLEAIRAPVFAVGTTSDHVAPVAIGLQGHTSFRQRYRLRAHQWRPQYRHRRPAGPSAAALSPSPLPLWRSPSRPRWLAGGNTGRRRFVVAGLV